MEVILSPDGGVTFRILGESAVPKATDTAGAKEWDAEIAKLKAKGGGKE